jgi:hypothetical protein
MIQLQFKHPEMQRFDVQPMTRRQSLHHISDKRIDVRTRRDDHSLPVTTGVGLRAAPIDYGLSTISRSSSANSDPVYADDASPISRSRTPQLRPAMHSSPRRPLAHMAIRLRFRLNLRNKCTTISPEEAPTRKVATGGHILHNSGSLTSPSKSVLSSDALACATSLDRIVRLIPNSVSIENQDRYFHQCMH